MASKAAASTNGARQSEPRSLLSAWTRDLSRTSLAALLLLYITSVHLTGLYVFTRGFLLTRISIPSVSPPYTPGSPPIIPPTHSKAVILIIDALRTDFISPFPPQPPSAYHHDVLTLPAELTEQRPFHSLIFNTFSDPPTTTMQRIKAITTGSLPTFVDAGSNFASTAIEEDSLIFQLVTANKTVGFMGDDTWANLFPSSFALSHPYDSFNVEDLHTVDNGVIEHLIPYLHPENSSRWDVLIGHFLGVDHIGHRVGPERDIMRTKLEQMDAVLRDVVDLLDEDTLLVVLGDHGMDDKGNHGGDSELETAAGLWMYSKGSSLASQESIDVTPTHIFPGSITPLPHINQIDLVPTLALLLGVPIPFNNLGSVIPACFSNPASLELATRTNAEQIMRYIVEYGDLDIETALSTSWGKARAADELLRKFDLAKPAQTPVERMTEWLRTGSATDPVFLDSVKRVEAIEHSTRAHREVAAVALGQLRALWAQFSLSFIVLGLVILGLSVPVLITLYVGVRNSSVDWDVFARMAVETIFIASFTIPPVPALALGVLYQDLGLAIRTFVITAAILSELALVLPLLIERSFPSVSSLRIQRWIGPVILATHAISFASNSFIMWEDRVVLFLAATIPIIYLIKALTAPTADMRIKIFFLCAAYMIITRLVSTITICREEQQPYCRVTFFSGSTPVAPAWALIILIPVAVQLPRIIAQFLISSKSLAGPARTFLGTIWRGVLVANALYWMLEFLESYEGLQPARIPLVNAIKCYIARLSFGATLLVLPYYLFTSGLCISIERGQTQTGEEAPVTVLGFANAYGSTYLLFLLIPFALIHTVTQPMGQFASMLLLISALVHVELIDVQRDAVIMQRSFAGSSQPGVFEPGGAATTALVQPGFTDVVPLVLLGFIGFFSTGHQAVLTSIQWKAAFVGFTEVTYPYSPVLVVLNTWGPFLLSSLTIPLLAIWKISPRPQSTIPLLGHTLQLSLAFLTYHAALTFASALFAAWLRRHLMVWKVFAPRFMLAGVTLLVVDLGVLMAVFVGLGMTSWKVWRTFRCESI
jgi:phosphatidylinositol glycan class O